MKVIILAGGFGTRLSEYTETIPKPMVTVGGRPIIWHIMRSYAYFGHKDFYLALGYKADVVKEYFLHYRFLNADFTEFPLRFSTASAEEHNWDVGDLCLPPTHRGRIPDLFTAWSNRKSRSVTNSASHVSLPQQIGDLILPCPFGHSDTLTVLPSSLMRVLYSNSVPHLPQLISATSIPQSEHEYFAIATLTSFEIDGDE